MIWLFERHIEQREAAALIRDARILVSGLGTAPDGTPWADAAPVDPRFTQLASGRYWQISTTRGAAHSESLWDQSLAPPPRASATEWQIRRAEGPFGKRILLVERSVRPDRGGPMVLVQVATNDEELRTANAEFERELAMSLLLLWLVLLIAAYMQVRLGLRPLARIRTEMDRLRRSAQARLTQSYPREIEPLTTAINALADAREADLARARKRAADLAHSLKTPLAALSAQSRRAREAGAESAADGLDHAIAAVGAALEAELARARAAAARSASANAQASPLEMAERVIGVVERTEQGESIIFDVAIDEALRVPLRSDDLAEILGALIENAARYARRQIRIMGMTDNAAATVSLIIGDDGPGIADGRAEAALMRGGRLDEAGPGHGLGLAIVCDLVEATEGTLSLGRSDLGGLEVRLDWPMMVRA
ncbi:ATP-binding protein [Sphingomonas oleivorans]|uniref:histidine kinase n=2 Tax=Sphingomonas oleivorans TaxID=1735121 RepID=A0A2T5G354_9SPHN|nr:ATP-binding protein [Sphingomonas oleivorans]